MEQNNPDIKPQLEQYEKEGQKYGDTVIKSEAAGFNDEEITEYSDSFNPQPATKNNLQVKQSPIELQNQTNIDSEDLEDTIAKSLLNEQKTESRVIKYIEAGIMGFIVGSIVAAVLFPNSVTNGTYLPNSPSSLLVLANPWVWIFGITFTVISIFGLKFLYKAKDNRD